MGLFLIIDSLRYIRKPIFLPSFPTFMVLDEPSPKLWPAKQRALLPIAVVFPLFTRHDVNALIASPKDTEALVRHISRLLDDQELRNRLANNARDSVLYFDRMESCRQTIKFLDFSTR